MTEELQEREIIKRATVMRINQPEQSKIHEGNRQC